MVIIYIMFCCVLISVFIVALLLYKIVRYKEKEAGWMENIAGVLLDMRVSLNNAMNLSPFVPNTDVVDEESDFDFEEINEDLIISNLYGVTKDDLMSNFRSIGILDTKDTDIEKVVDGLKRIEGNVDNKE